MARGNVERKFGRRRNTFRVEQYAGQLVRLRAELDGSTDATPNRDVLLQEAAMAAADLSSTATRMDRDGNSRRAACEAILARETTLRSVELSQVGA